VSRIGKKSINVEDGIEVKLEHGAVVVKGPKGELRTDVDADIEVKIDGGSISLVNRREKDKKARALHGLYRSLIANMVLGVKEGFEKKLELHGIGYRAQQDGKKISLALGYSHPIVVEPAEGIEFKVMGQTKISITGIDKQKVGQAAAEIKKLRKTEPYKGKGIRFEGETFVKKQGKSVKK
jgi:large subunit ribosomal protein L6